MKFLAPAEQLCVRILLIKLCFVNIEDINVTKNMTECEDKHESDLLDAAKEGNLQLVKCLIQSFPGSDPKTFSLNTPFFVSSDLIEVYIMLGNYKDNTILSTYAANAHYDVVMGQVDILQHFMKESDYEDLCHQNLTLDEITKSYGWRPLHWAAYEGHLEIVRYLMEEANGIKKQPREFVHGLTPIHLAAYNGKLDVLKYFMENWEDFEIEKEPDDNDGFRPIHFAAFEGHIDVVRYLVEEANEIDKQPKEHIHGWRPIHLAAKNGQLDVVRYFIEDCKEFAIEKQPEDNEGFKPVHLALFKRQSIVEKYLLKSMLSPFGENFGNMIKQFFEQRLKYMIDRNVYIEYPQIRNHYPNPYFSNSSRVL